MIGNGKHIGDIWICKTNDSIKNIHHDFPFGKESGYVLIYKRNRLVDIVKVASQKQTSNRLAKKWIVFCNVPFIDMNPTKNGAKGSVLISIERKIGRLMHKNCRPEIRKDYIAKHWPTPVEPLTRAQKAKFDEIVLPLEDAASQTPGQTPGQKPGQTPGQTPGQKLGQTPGETSEQTHGQTPGQTPGETSEQTPGQTPSQTTNLLEVEPILNLKDIESFVQDGNSRKQSRKQSSKAKLKQDEVRLEKHKRSREVHDEADVEAPSEAPVEGDTCIELSGVYKAFPLVPYEDSSDESECETTIVNFRSAKKVCLKKPDWRYSEKRHYMRVHQIEHKPAQVWILYENGEKVKFELQ
jgi:hypothetical protein